MRYVTFIILVISLIASSGCTKSSLNNDDLVKENKILSRDGYIINYDTNKRNYYNNNKIIHKSNKITLEIIESSNFGDNIYSTLMMMYPSDMYNTIDEEVYFIGDFLVYNRNIEYINNNKYKIKENDTIFHLNGKNITIAIFGDYETMSNSTGDISYILGNIIIDDNNKSKNKINSRYSGCKKNDIKVGKQIRASCDIGNITGKINYYYFGNNSPIYYSGNELIINKQLDYKTNGRNKINPCLKGYHIPSQKERKYAFKLTKENGFFLRKILGLNLSGRVYNEKIKLLNEGHYRSSSNKNNENYGLVLLEKGGRVEGEKEGYLSKGTNIKDIAFPIRCIKD